MKNGLAVRSKVPALIMAQTHPALRVWNWRVPALSALSTDAPASPLAGFRADRRANPKQNCFHLTVKGSTGIDAPSQEVVGLEIDEKFTESNTQASVFRTQGIRPTEMPSSLNSSASSSLASP
jgi:hypothetical protein